VNSAGIVVFSLSESLIPCLSELDTIAMDIPTQGFFLSFTYYSFKLFNNNMLQGHIFFSNGCNDSTENY
jgi:hypothetical protein